MEMRIDHPWRRSAEARPRPGQTKAPTPSARLLGNPQKLQRNEVHTRQNTRDHDPRRIDQSTRDHDPRQIDQCNIHTHVIVPDNKSPVEKKSCGLLYINYLYLGVGRAPKIDIRMCVPIYGFTAKIERTTKCSAAAVCCEKIK